jgi:hypothetical protein
MLLVSQPMFLVSLAVRHSPEPSTRVSQLALKARLGMIHPRSLCWSEPAKTTPQQNATPAQPAESVDGEISTEVADLIGGGGWTRTNDLRIMSPEAPIADKEDKALSSAESGKVLQNRQPPRNQNQALPPLRKNISRFQQDEWS